MASELPARPLSFLDDLDDTPPPPDGQAQRAAVLARDGEARHGQTRQPAAERAAPGNILTTPEKIAAVADIIRAAPRGLTLDSMRVAYVLQRTTIVQEMALRLLLCGDLIAYEEDDGEWRFEPRDPDGPLALPERATLVDVINVLGDDPRAVFEGLGPFECIVCDPRMLVERRGYSEHIDTHPR